MILPPSIDSADGWVAAESVMATMPIVVVCQRVRTAGRPDHRRPTRKPHDLRHGIATDISEKHHDLEAMRAMLGHPRIDQAK